MDAVVKHGLKARFWIFPEIQTAKIIIIDRIEKKHLPEKQIYLKLATQLNNLERGAKLQDKIEYESEAEFEEKTAVY